MAITIKRAITDELENLGKIKFKKFCDELLDRRQEPRVLRSDVEDKDPGDIAQLLVSTFTEPEALQVALDTLRKIKCNEAAKTLESKTRKRPKVSVDKKKRNPPSPGPDRPRPPTKRQRSLAEASQSGREYPAEETKDMTSKAGSSSSAGASAGTDQVTPKADGAHFVDKYREELTQKVKSIPQILDRLLTKKVIDQETYDKIRVMKPSQEQMRELFDALNTARAKEVFYEILVEMQTFLIEDLKKN